MVISNPEKQQIALMDGKILDPYQKRDDSPGIIFFNKYGDEIGGLIQHTNDARNATGLAFDQFKNDEAVVLSKDEKKVNGKWERTYGLTINERADKPITQSLTEFKNIQAIQDQKIREEKLAIFKADPNNITMQRLFVGRNAEETVGLFLQDKQNRKRISIYLDQNDEPKLEFFDANGNALSINSILK